MYILVLFLLIIGGNLGYKGLSFSPILYAQDNEDESAGDDEIQGDASHENEAKEEPGHEEAEDHEEKEASNDSEVAEPEQEIEVTVNEPKETQPEDHPDDVNTHQKSMKHKKHKHRKHKKHHKKHHHGGYVVRG